MEKRRNRGASCLQFSKEEQMQAVRAGQPESSHSPLLHQGIHAAHVQLHHQAAEANEDENSAVQAALTADDMQEEAFRAAAHAGKAPKRHNARWQQKRAIRQEYAAAKSSRRPANRTAPAPKAAANAVPKAENIKKRLRQTFARHPTAWAVLALAALLLAVMSSRTRVAVIDRSAPTVQASITVTTLQVEVQDDLSGVAGVQVNSMLFTEQAGSLIRIALDDTLARYDTLSIRAFDYAGNFSEPVLLNNPCYEDAVRVTAAPTNSPKPTKQPNSTAEIIVQPTATKRPNGLGGSLIYVSEVTSTTAAPTQAPSPTPVIQYVPIGPGMPYKADGNAHTLDVLYSAATNKQFITLQSKNGSTFYLVIDYDKPIDEAAEMYETYFLNLVDERDLLALLSDEEKEELPTPSPEIIYVTPVPTTVPMPTAAPEKGGSSDRMTAVLALGGILLLGGAGAFVLVKYRRNSARHRADNDFMLDDDDESAE